MDQHTKRALLSALAQAQQILFNVEDEDQELVVMQKLGERKYTPRVCFEGYTENTVLRYSFEDFKRHFRPNRSTFEILLTVFEAKMSNVTGRPPVEPKKKLLSVLWLLSNQETFRSVADRFDVSTSMLHGYLQQICNMLAETASQFIYWPEDLDATERNFKEISGFPGVIGAIDRSHIPIKAPIDNPERYFNRKKFYSIVLQGVANPDLTFSHITCSFPGSVHDARVLVNSDIHRWFANSNYFPAHMHLIGDSAYPLLVNLIVPYKNNGHLKPRQINFNKKLSQTRVCVERAFGLLKGRFRRLKNFDADVLCIPLYVLACCILHNICIRSDDLIDDREERDDDDDGDDDTDFTATNKRDYICGVL